MGVEIERKFIVNPDLIERLPEPILINQFYLSGATRIRITTEREGAAESRTDAFLTIKGEGTIRRAEYEYNIPVNDADDLRSMAKTGLRKNRYRIPVGDHVWDVDEFLLFGGVPGTPWKKFDIPFAMSNMWMAEVELTDEGEKFQVPRWVEHEVTGEKGYSNAQIATGKWPLPRSRILGQLQAGAQIGILESHLVGGRDLKLMSFVPEKGPTMFTVSCRAYPRHLYDRLVSSNLCTNLVFGCGPLTGETPSGDE